MDLNQIAVRDDAEGIRRKYSKENRQEQHARPFGGSLTHLRGGVILPRKRADCGALHTWSSCIEQCVANDSR
jgi:hypothetical protein